MTQPLQPTEPFAQHPRLAELVTALGSRRYLLFLTGLLYQEPGGPLRRATGRQPRPQPGVLRARGGRLDQRPPQRQRGRHRAAAPLVPAQGSAPPVITGSEVLGVVPLEVTDALLDELRRPADRHERGFLVEHVMELLDTS